MINYELLNFPTSFTVICGSINVLSNKNCQNISYCWVLIFSCCVFQDHVTGILQVIPVLFLIPTHQIFRHFLSHMWHVLQTKSQITLLPIQIV